MEKVSLADKLARIPDHWRPRIVAEVNNCHVKLVKLQGEFVWHSHASEDELFLVLAGRLLMRFRDSELWLGPGELVCVPRGVEHCPVAPEEAHVLLIEPKTTLNTGDAGGERTAPAEWI
jgi:mannose-6-phosphate isomerase-like protein (cupin superfamily)